MSPFLRARVNRTLLSALIAIILLACLPAQANSYLAELRQEAQARKLHESPQWHALLHYKKRFGVLGVRSLADDKRFFNAPHGKTDPRTELDATLEAFFSAEQETDGTQNPQCRFIARYQWLKSELHFDPARLPEQPCQRFHRWRAALDPGRITLVFASAYLNNPSSAYGHSLLRVDRKGQQDNTSLLAYAISYAARADDANALVFGVKGLFGGYDGTYAMSPYYVKVSEYNDFENRDLWEYELDLTQEEIERIVMHVWELGPIGFDYFFFDENCAYQLLLLIDAARPSLALADNFPLWAIPADTIRAATESPGLVKRVVYRPSRSTVLRTRAGAMRDEEIDASKKLAAGVLSADDLMSSGTKRAATLDLAYEYLDYQRERAEASGPKVGVRLRNLLSARSKVGAPSDLDIPTPKVRPDQGHRSARLGLGLGTLEGKGYQEIRIRPAYHDLLDPQEGYLRGSQIDFFNFVFRHENGKGSLKLEKLDLAHVVSLSPRDRLIKPISWSASFGADRLRKAGGTDALRARITGAGGLTYAWESVLVYGMIGIDVQASRHLEQGYAAGPGLLLGTYFDVHPRWRVGATVQRFQHLLGDEHGAWEASLEQRITLSPAWALRIELGDRHEFGLRTTTVGGFVSFYF